MNPPDSEAGLDFRESADDIVEEPTTISEQAKPIGELTYLNRVVTEPVQSFFGCSDGSITAEGCIAAP